MTDFHPREIRRASRKKRHEHHDQIDAVIREWWLRAARHRDPLIGVVNRKKNIDYRVHEGKKYYAGQSLHQSFVINTGHNLTNQQFLCYMRRVVKIKNRRPFNVMYRDDDGRLLYSSTRTFYEV